MKGAKQRRTQNARSYNISTLTEHGPVLRPTEHYRNPINYKLRQRPSRSRSPGSLFQICSAACFRFVSPKVRKTGGKETTGET